MRSGDDASDVAGANGEGGVQSLRRVSVADGPRTTGRGYALPRGLEEGFLDLGAASMTRPGILDGDEIDVAAPSRRTARDIRDLYAEPNACSARRRSNGSLYVPCCPANERLASSSTRDAGQYCMRLNPAGRGGGDQIGDASPASRKRSGVSQMPV